jgi:hypothetical protein
MKFFNIRYECNDARDDYFKLLKQNNTTDGVFPHWFKGDDNDSFDDDNYDDSGDFIAGSYPSVVSGLGVPSEHLILYFVL